MAALGTYDITTIRASMGMYLVCKAIREHTDVRVLLTGEISDELFGYKYIPTLLPPPRPSSRRPRSGWMSFYMYDVLRADRCISVHSIEARVPFGDLDFVKYVMGVDPALKMNTYGKGKYLLRHAFEGDHLLPQDILWREKAAFSDAVGHSLVDDLKEYAESKYNRPERSGSSAPNTTSPLPSPRRACSTGSCLRPTTPARPEWSRISGCPTAPGRAADVDDPSARVLANYGASGF